MLQIAGNIELLGKKFWRRREKQTYETVALGLNANFSDHWQMRNQIGKKKAPTVDTSKDLIRDAVFIFSFAFNLLPKSEAT